MQYQEFSWLLYTMWERVFESLISEVLSFHWINLERSYWLHMVVQEKCQEKSPYNPTALSF